MLKNKEDETVMSQIEPHSAIASYTRQPRRLSVARPLGLAAMTLVLGTTGCTRFIQRTTGNVLVEHARSNGVPYVMASQELDLAYNTGFSLATLIETFSNVGVNTAGAAIPLYVLAGFHAEQEHTFPNRLRYLRAVYAGNGPEAQDARIAERRGYAETAHLRYLAWQRAEKYFGPLGDKCPKMKDDVDNLLLTFGVLGGLLAVLDDANAMGVEGVPMDIAGKAARTTDCLDNEKWWGLPQAIKGAVWVSVPGAAPPGKSGWDQMNQAKIVGERNGAFVAYVLEAMVAYSNGKTDLLKQSIRDFVKKSSGKEPPKTAAIMNELARQQLTVLSDMLWIEATGHRTPFNNLGKFPDDKDVTEDTSGLLP
jgi:hypothetical protein